ncbi:MAG: JAB domain-containing protein [Alkaliphilus sp.]
MSKIEHKEIFFKSVSKLTAIPISIIKEYSSEHNLFNILEHPMVLDLSKNQLELIKNLNELISSYNVLKMNEESSRIKLGSTESSGAYFGAQLCGMKDKERFLVAFLDNSHRVIETRKVAEGTVGSVIIYPRDILKMAMANDCKAIILAHNHPGGTIRASREDMDITKKIVNIFHPLGIKVLDHIIVGGNRFSSMSEDNNMPTKAVEDACYKKIKHEELEEGQENYINDYMQEDCEEDELEM